MGTYLQDNPPRIQQFRCPRRRAPSGIIGVHTAESIADETGPDTGAENVARFIRDRTNYGSYHDLCDSDSIIQLVPYDCVAYHIGTHSLNEHTYGVSAATQAAKWDSLGDDWVEATVRNMARASARYAKWFQNRYGLTIPARRITLAQALDDVRGFLAHGDADPDRRTDPGKLFPWSMFLSFYKAEMANGDTMSWQETLTPTDLAASRFPDSYSTRADYALMHILGLVYQANFDKVAPNGWMKDRWPDIPDDGYSRRVLARAAYGHARAANENSAALLKGQARMEARQAAIEDLLHQLLDTPGQPIDMDQVSAAALAGAQQAMAELDITVRINPAEEPT